MRARRHILWLAALGLLQGLFLGACRDPNAPLWEDAGTLHATATALVVGGPVTESDTLPVVAIGFSQSGKPIGCRVDFERTDHQVDLTLWVRMERWVGSGPPPPYDLMFECAFMVLPPISLGVFRVVLHQPDGSTLADSVFVSSPEGTMNGIARGG